MWIMFLYAGEKAWNSMGIREESLEVLYKIAAKETEKIFNEYGYNIEVRVRVMPYV